MSFDRRFIQETCEQEVGHTSDQVQLRTILKQTQLTTSHITSLRSAANLDIPNYYYKGLVSLFDAISSLSEKKFSWATVKIYYSVYYLLHAEMLARGTALVRARGLFKIVLSEGETFTCNERKEYRSDHSATINYYIDSFGKSDPILSNKIDNMESYIWLMNQRERVNYRERYFNEPQHPDFWAGPASLGLDFEGITRTIQTYLDDTSMAFTFQNDHAVLAIPIKRLQIATTVLAQYGHQNLLSGDQRTFLRGILICSNLESYINL